MSEHVSPNIDTSYWQGNNRDWLKERGKDWPRIAKMLTLRKSKKAINVIKQYYLKGKMPDWYKWAESDNYERHLDLFLFLWCHPSRDKALLIRLRNEYMHSCLVTLEDITLGYSYFSVTEGVIDTTRKNFRIESLAERFGTYGENELFFDVMLNELDQPKYMLDCISLYSESKTERETFEVLRSSFNSVYMMKFWLCLKSLHPINEDFLYQYDKPLEWWCRSSQVCESYFSNDPQEKNVRKFFIGALYCIWNFNTEKEGDTCRTRFVHKMRKILNEREFIADFKQMWQNVKSNNVNVDVKDPWCVNAESRLH